jgi:hypothetical protein
VTWLHWFATALAAVAILLCVPALLGNAAKRWPMMEGRHRAQYGMQVAVIVLWVSAMVLYMIAGETQP